MGTTAKTFTLAQSSRVVFHTMIETHIITTGDLIQGGATGVWLSVEILNAANAVVARSTSDAWLAQSIPQSINSSGIGVLPAGTYRTRVTFNRQPGGAKLDVIMAPYGLHPNQGGQMIIEIFRIRAVLVPCWTWALLNSRRRRRVGHFSRDGTSKSSSHVVAGVRRPTWNQLLVWITGAGKRNEGFTI